MGQSFPRILATIEEMESLLYLDERGIEDLDQEIYMLRSGFITGEREPWKEIASRLNHSPGEVRRRFNVALARLKSTTNEGCCQKIPIFATF